jgi:hypothetical protein
MSLGRYETVKYHPSAKAKAAAELELRRRASGAGGEYQYAPAAYIKDKLGWEPWAGEGDAPGQIEVLDAYAAALRQQHEQPDTPAQNRIRIEAGHTVGKTKLASGIVNHFFDNFAPSIIYTFAPTWEQIHDLLWKEIKSDRRGKGLPGRILDLGLELSDNHFAKGRATSNAGGQGTERAQGQHGKYLMFVLDEAEGIDEYVWDAVESMTSGGISIVLMLANPRTRISQFHKAASDDRVVSFRISCLQHPNVIHNREIVPGAVKRAYVDGMLKKHCEVVQTHNDDAHTFELPWQPGIIYEPDSEFLFRVRGIAPANMADNTFVPVGRYEKATKRVSLPTGPVARMGVDVARYGKDRGTLYLRRGDNLRHIAYFAKQDTGAYARRIVDEARKLAASGVTSLHIRVDGGGGFGGGVIDRLNEDEGLRRLFADFRVLEVHFNGTPNDESAYADTATEMYAHAADALQVLAVQAPEALEQDLCERTYKWVKLHGVDVKKLTPKEEFKKEFKRSPDDGDGAALAAAPDYLWPMKPPAQLPTSHSMRTY